MPSRETLIQPIRSLCIALSAAAPVSDILSKFTVSPQPLAQEYGLKCLAPFLGRSFTGQGGVAEYFRLLTDLLAVKNMSFEDESTWVVDENLMTVGLRARAQFVWKDTRQVWDDEFFYRIEVAQEDDEAAGKGRWKVQEFRVWPDTGAAYLARLGKLAEVVGQDQRVEGNDGAESAAFEEIAANNL